MLGFLNRLFNKKEYYNEDSWSFINDETNDWKKSKSKKKPKYIKKRSPITKFKTLNIFDILQ